MTTNLGKKKHSGTCLLRFGILCFGDTWLSHVNILSGQIRNNKSVRICNHTINIRISYKIAVVQLT
jgi:hypothetical protein